jgi:hypothetical protein
MTLQENWGETFRNEVNNRGTTDKKSLLSQVFFIERTCSKFEKIPRVDLMRRTESLFSL